MFRNFLHFIIPKRRLNKKLKALKDTKNLLDEVIDEEVRKITQGKRENREGLKQVLKKKYNTILDYKISLLENIQKIIK